MTNSRIYPVRGEHERLLRLVRKLRQQLLKLQRHGDIHEAVDTPDEPVCIEIERIDRFLRWRERMLNRSTAGEIMKRLRRNPPPPVVLKALRTASDLGGT